MRTGGTMAATVDELNSRQEVHDLMLRYTRGLDRLDVNLVADCYHAEARHDHGMFQGTGHEFARYAVDSIRSMERTLHCMLNTLMDFKTPNYAAAESYGMALHRVASTGAETGWADHTAFVRYVDHLERRDDRVWKIADRVVVYEWTRVDPVAREWRLEGFSRGARDRSDPVYTAGVVPVLSDSEVGARGDL